MRYTIHPITKQDAEEIATWQYPPPYTIYSLTAEVIPVLLDPSNQYFSVKDDDQLVGYCCYGPEGKVKGGQYEGSEGIFLDIGVGMRPDRVGKGEGKKFVGAILDHGFRRYKTQYFRVTIAEFNKRSLKAFQSLGFEESSRFKRAGDNLTFVQLERETPMSI
jgi:RimJ/RimL family protein N-acetyltransferase